MLLMYAGGIAALSSDNYRSLSTLLVTKLGNVATGEESQEAITPTVHGIREVQSLNLFKTLPGHEKHFAPRSEYLFKVLQPPIEDQLFLGMSYEELFDRFEIFFALLHADVAERRKGHFWGPAGRFGWKHRSRVLGSPYDAVVQEAQQYQTAWLPLQAGLFEGSLDRFVMVATRYRDEVLNSLPWY